MVIACQRLKREFIGIEIDEKYFRIADQRLKDESRQMTVFDFYAERESNEKSNQENARKDS